MNRRWLHTPLIALLGLLAACSSDATGTGDSGAGDAATDVVDDSVDPVDQAGETDDERDCIPGIARCIGETTTEVCSDDSEWEVTECGTEQLCWGGDCGTIGTCTPGEVERCIDFGTYQGCNPLGTGTGEIPVDFEMTCVDDTLVLRDCLEGDTMCQDEQVLLRCDASGLGYEQSTNCFEDDSTTLCDDGRCISLCQFIEKQESYVGCEYWAVDLDNAFLTNGAGIPIDAYFAQFAVAVSNPGGTLTAEVTVRSVDEVLKVATVAPGQMVVLELPPSSIEGTMQGFEGYQITSTVPIVAYQFNPLEDELVYSNDASLLLPTSSLGTRYYVMTRRQTFESLKGSLTVVATQEGTTEITALTLPERTFLNPLETLPGDGIPVMQGGDTRTFTLQQFEVLNLETNHLGADLTGTLIESDRPVAVFGGTEASNAPNTDSCIRKERPAELAEEDRWVCEFDRETPCWDTTRNEPNIALCSTFVTCCADHLEQQMLPIFAWGREYNAARSAPRGDEADVWRVMAAEANTQVRLIGIPENLGEPIRTNYTIGAGEWFEFESRADFEIVADKPIFVGQFLAAEFAPYPEGEPNPQEYPDNAGTGDPAFIMGVPREQYRSDYIFLVPGQYETNWVTIVAPAGVDVDHTDEVGSETLSADLFEPFSDGVWAAMRYELVNEGYHRLEAEQPIGAMVHGYDQFVSYGYPAGLDVKKLDRRREN